MLKKLEIRNIALIDEVDVDFTMGMNCLTGETGAGKSIIIDSIGCILGDRASRDLIRTGCDSAAVKGLFCIDDMPELPAFLAENKLDTQNGVFEISREFDKSGKNICRFNGKNITLSLLKELGSFLIDVHGQHDNQSLLKTDTHIVLLDRFGGKEIGSLLEEYRALRSACSKKQSEIKKLTGDPAERARRIDLLRYQADEISAAKLKKGEDEALAESHRYLVNAEKIIESLSDAYAALSEGGSGSSRSSSALDLTGEAMSELEKISGISDGLKELFTRTQEIYYDLEDLSSSMRKELENASFEPDELEKTDARIDAINSLKRKYGSTIEEIIAFGKNAEETAEKLEGSEEYIQSLEREISSYHAKMKIICEKLHDERVKTAQTLEKLVSNELADLEMPGAVFSVDILYDGADAPDFTSNGLDSVEFLMSANRGEPLKPLSRVASGGELSRIMLAIKKIFADVDSIPTMIFDEIDIGISGKTASSLGEKLRFISKSHQVICVTHLAQIAARAAHNIIVSKSFNGKSTVTRVNVPDEKERIAEIARLLDGNPESEVALRHAEEMIETLNN